MVCEKTIGAMKYEIKNHFGVRVVGFLLLYLYIYGVGSVVGVRACIRKSGMPLQLH